MTSQTMNKCLRASRRYRNKGLRCIQQGLSETDQGKKDNLALYAQMYFRQARHFDEMIMNYIKEEAER